MCLNDLLLKDSLAGKKIKCPKCGGMLNEVDLKADPLVGKKFAHYLILSKIGEGGMGAVYKAQNLRLNKPVALKMVSTQKAKQDPTYLERFIREAQSAAQLEHPNVVTVHYVGNEAGHYFIEMQYVEGSTVRDRLKEPPSLLAAEATQIAIEAAKALRAAHAKGIVHRDVKPDNIMITREGAIKVADFGLAGLASKGEVRTGSGLVLGTPYYMSPEQCRGEATDARSDIYSLGATYYHMLTGSPPFHGEKPNQVAKLHVSGPVPSLQALRPDLPGEIEQIVTKTMAKAPAERYPSCEELIADLTNAAAILAQQKAGAPAGQPSRRSWAPIVLPVAIGLVLVGMVAGVLAMTGLWRKPTPKTPKETKPSMLVVEEPSAPGERKPEPKGPEATKAEPKKPETPPAEAATSPEKGTSPLKPAAPGAEELTGKDLLTQTEQPKKAEPTAVPTPEPAPKAAEEAPAPKTASEETPAPEPAKPADTMDLAAYAAAVQSIDQMVEERNFDQALAETNVAAAKVMGSKEHIQRKRANIELLKKQWAKVKEQINSGKVKLTMKDISPKYAYAGDVAQVDDSGITARSGKVQVPFKWDKLSKDEQLKLRKVCLPPKDAESALALAAFCCEGTRKLYDEAEGFLGTAAELGADINPLVAEILFLRGLPAPAAAEPKKSEAEEQKASPAEAKAENRPEQKKPETGEKMEKAEAPYEYRNRYKQEYRFPLDSPKPLFAAGINVPEEARFVKGAKMGAIMLSRYRLALPMRLPEEGGVIEFMVRVAGEKVDCAIVNSRSTQMDSRSPGQRKPGIHIGVYGKRLGAWFPNPNAGQQQEEGEGEAQGQGQGQRRKPIICQDEMPWDEWVTIAFEWGERGTRLYVNGIKAGEEESVTKLPGGISELDFFAGVRGEDGRMIQRDQPQPKFAVLLDEVYGYLPKRGSKGSGH